VGCPTVAAVVGKRFLVVALVCAFAVSCGGGATTTPGASAAAGASTAATTAPTSAAATAAATSAAGANQPKLLDLLSAAKLSEYKITYKITATGQGAEAMSGDQTWYFKPPKSRFDFSSTFGGQKTTISFFSLPDGSYYCFGGAGQPVTCLSVGGVGSPLDQNAAAVTQRQLIESPDKFGASFTETKTIAGQQALCYAVTGAAGTFSTGTFCYSKTGLALLSTFSVQGSAWTMEATNISTTVPDSDFTLPAKPIKP
jgi:hypothetical protein